MKKGLILAFALCVLFLSACSSLVGTSAPFTNAPAHVTASTQSACSTLEGSQAKLDQQYQAASAQLAAARARGNLQQGEAAEAGLTKLRQGIAWVQALRNTC